MQETRSWVWQFPTPNAYYPAVEPSFPAGCPDSREIPQRDSQQPITLQLESGYLLCFLAHESFVGGLFCFVSDDNFRFHLFYRGAGSCASSKDVEAAHVAHLFHFFRKISIKAIPSALHPKS